MSAFCPPSDAALVVTRPQRLAILCVAVMTNFAFNAYFFGAEAKTMSQTIVIGLLSALAMAHAHHVLPRLFAAANTFTSKTSAAEVEAERKKKLKKSGKAGEVMVAAGRCS